MKTLKELAMVQLLQSRLCSDLRTCAQTIDVVVENGQIFLVGTCDSVETKETVQLIVEGTCGVSIIVDQLDVRIKRSIVST